MLFRSTLWRFLKKREIELSRGPQPSARPLLPRGALPSLVPSLRAPAGSPRPGRAERGGGEGREERAGGGRQAGERRGAAWSPDFPEPARSAHSAALRVPAAPRRPAPPSSSRDTPSPSPSSSCYARASGRPPAPLGHIPNSADSLPGRASSPHPFFLPAFPRARPPSPGLPSGSRLSPSPPRCAGASPCPVSPSHFLSRRPPLPRLQPAAPGEGRSGRARPRPAPRPSPARRGKIGRAHV